MFCDTCLGFFGKEISKIAKSRSLLHLTKLKTPITITSPNRLKLTIQDQHKCAELEKQLEEMKLELAKSSIEVDNELSNNLIEIYSNNPCR